MCSIFENLYIGDINDVCNEILKLKLNITHILTVEHRPLSKHILKGAVYHYVHLLDTEDSDLLTYLPSCMGFIEEGRKQGAVMVHCFAGQSRSGAVMVGFLMKQLGISCGEALSYARKMKADICPNQGFIVQLDLYGRMGCTLDENDPSYRSFKLQILSTNIQNAQNRTQLIEKYLDQSNNPPPNKAIYQCKKCRQTLFTENSVLKHELHDSNNKAMLFKNKSRNQAKVGLKNSPSGLKNSPSGLKNSPTGSTNSPTGSTNSPSDQCSTSIFLEPVAWMKGFIHELSGKFSCPKCSSKLGSWDWTGNQCSCGKWLTPSFQIVASKVDLVTSLPTTVPAEPKPTRTNYVFRE